MKIEISQSTGVVRVLDPRIFREDRRAWCRALADHAAGCRDVRSVRLDLDAAACEIRFVAEPSAHAMAGVLAASIRAADAPRSCRLSARRGWFARRSPEPLAWSCLTAFPEETSASIWASRVREPGVIEIEHSSLWGSRTRSRAAGRRHTVPISDTELMPG